MRRLLAALLIAGGLLVPTFAQDTDDPPDVITTYRGSAQRTGTLDAEPLTETPVVAWEYPVERPIRMTPAVAEDRVFIGSEAGILHAVDLESGEGLWSFDAGGSLVATPSIDTGGRLFVGALNGRFYALNTENGDVLWSDEIGGQVYPSPLMLESRVIVGSTNGTIAAYAADDGTRLWSFDAGGAVWSSPAAAEDGNTIYIGSRGGGLLALTPDGELRWRFEPGSNIDATPAVVGDRLYAGAYNGVFYALDAATGEELWTQDLGDPIYASAAVTEDRIFVNTLQGSAFALDRESGVILWQIDIGGPAYASPTVAGAVVHFVTERDALLIAVNALDGETLWELNTGYEGDWRVSSAIIVDDLLLIGSNERQRGLIAFGLP